MITKKELTEKLKELLKNVTPGDLQAINQKISEHLKFGVENYDQLEPDAQRSIDEALKGISTYFGEAVEKIPECKEKRKLKRIYAVSIGEHQKIEYVISALETAPNLKDENSKEFRKIFIIGLQHIIDLLFDIRQASLKGPARFGQLSLICMCIDELLVTLHLAQHHYVNQAFTHIRTVFEHLDKIELFRRSPEWAQVWCGNDEKKIRRELSPSEVRKKLGKNRYDPMYDMFSTLGPHGTFKAVQSQTATKATLSAKGHPEIQLWYAGCPLEHNIVGANAFGLYSLLLVLLQIMQSFGDLLNHEECEEIAREMYKYSNKYIKDYFLEWAKKSGLTTDKLESYISSRSWEAILKQ